MVNVSNSFVYNLFIQTKYGISMHPYLKMNQRLVSQTKSEVEVDG